jgi:hypothetical protein
MALYSSVSVVRCQLSTNLNVQRQVTSQEQYNEGHPLSCCMTSASDIAEMNVIIKAEDVDRSVSALVHPLAIDDLLRYFENTLFL